MKSLSAAFVLAVGALMSFAPAQATTTVYTDSSDPQWGGFPNAFNSGAALGRPDGISASVPIGGFIAFQVNPLFTTVNFNLEFTGVTGAGTVRLYVGRTNGTGGFSALNNRFFTVANGPFNFNSPALSAYCLGLGGCDTYVTQAWTATTFGLDSVLASNPEPSVWALMILGFASVAARLKKLRGSRSSAEYFDIPAPAKGV